jgi:hypothetical protein
MSNHYHVVLYVDAAQAEAWSREDVIERWHRLFNGTLLSQRHARGESLSQVERKVLDKDVTIWRQRLRDISWFMVTPAHPCAPRHSYFHVYRA